MADTITCEPSNKFSLLFGSHVPGILGRIEHLVILVNMFLFSDGRVDTESTMLANIILLIVDEDIRDQVVVNMIKMLHVIQTSV